MRTYLESSGLLKSGARRIRRLLLALPVVFCVYILVADENGLYHIRHRDRQIEHLQFEIDSLRTVNDNLVSDLELLKTDRAAIERIARERYGMVKANERVYMVYPAPPESHARNPE